FIARKTMAHRGRSAKIFVARPPGDRWARVSSAKKYFALTRAIRETDAYEVWEVRRAWNGVEHMEKASDIRKLAFVGDYLPRRCGIATFTTDLLQVVAAEFPQTECFAVPVNDVEGGYIYPGEVRFEVDQQDLASYRRAADFLNMSNVDVVS